MLSQVIFSLAAICMCVLLSPPALAQSFNPELTDPTEIAAECGGDAQAGLPGFQQQCAACHSLTEGSGQQGPHLAALYGRMAGGLEGYSYASDLPTRVMIWEGETLHQLLSGEVSVPGHPVVPSEQMRRDILTYVRIETRPAPPEPDTVVVPAEVAAMEGDVAYGEYLASDCAQCHNPGAVARGTPQISGQSREHLMLRLYQYKARALPSPEMQMQAARLSGEEIAALAAYLSTKTN